VNIRVITKVLLLVSTTFSLCAQEPPAPWKHQDIGATQVAGTAKFADSVFTLQGTMDLWGPADGCHFVSQPWHGDVEVVARIVSMDNPGKVAHAKAGLCIRDSVDAGSRCVALCVTAGDGVQMTARDATDGKTARVRTETTTPGQSVAKATFPCWLKLVRRGGEFSGFESADGKTWWPTGRITLEFKDDTVAGFTSSSHTKDTLTTSVFDRVSVSAPKSEK
jgi:hypothetical protein